MHDEVREEIEIKFNKNDFENLEKLFSKLNYKTKIKWFRKRKQFDRDGIKVCLDYTKGYGHIIEFEKISAEKQKEKILNLLKNKLVELKINLTPKKEFEKKFAHYQKNWKKLAI
ncbi:MAG: hypothetical protein QMD86_01295 [Patescibacteria group bacterium]|nr:hypothetical protein [Patescibacteria group bacterium]